MKASGVRQHMQPPELGLTNLLCVCSLQLLQNAPDEVLVMASSTLCNLLLEFSPSKEVQFPENITSMLHIVNDTRQPLLCVCVCSPSWSQG